MNPSYEISTINTRTLGFGDPLRVKSGQRVLLHIVNTSATDPHWIALAGHQFEVIALDGNAVPRPQRVPMLCLSPAERVSAIVDMNNPGVWGLGEVRKRVMAAGMGIVVEYANQSGKPRWKQPDNLTWDYLQFGAATPPMTPTPDHRDPSRLPIEVRRPWGYGPLVHQRKVLPQHGDDHTPSWSALSVALQEPQRRRSPRPFAPPHLRTSPHLRPPGETRYPQRHRSCCLPDRGRRGVHRRQPWPNPVPLPSAGPHGHGIHDALPICYPVPAGSGRSRAGYRRTEQRIADDARGDRAGGS